MIKAASILLVCASFARADVLLNVGTVQNLLLAPTLAQAINATVDTLAQNTNATWDYAAANLDVQTNRNVWTWPVNMTWLGYCTNLVGGVNFQTILLTSNTILTAAHFTGAIGQNLNFRDTNGVIWAAICTNDVFIGDDQEIGQLSNAIPASVSPVWVFPPSYTNYFAGHSLTGVRGIWCRRNGGSDAGNPYESTLQYSSIVDESYVDFLALTATGYGPFGFGLNASGGDSGGPGFTIFNGLPVILFATNSGYPHSNAPEVLGGAQGPFISNANQWAVIAANGLTNGLQILTLNGFRQF